MKRMLRIAAGIALVASLAGCELLFSGKNLFAGLDGPNTDDLKSAKGTKLIDLLKESKGGESGEFGTSFFEKIKADGVSDEIVTNLKAVYTDEFGELVITSTADAEAALLAMDITLGTTETGPMVNNIVSAVMNAEQMEPEYLLSTMLAGSSAASDPFAFVSFMDSMLDVANTYTAIGEAYSDPSNGELVPIDLADGQTAVVSIVFSTIAGIVEIPAEYYSEPGFTDLTFEQQQSYVLFDAVIQPTMDGIPVDFATVFGSGEVASAAFDDLLAIDSDPLTEGVQVDPATGPFSALLVYSGASTLAEMMQ